MGLLAIPHIKDYINYEMESPTQKAIQEKFEREDDVFTNLEFALLDPEEAPETIRENVLLGYGIMINSQELVKDFVGSSLTCSNCHFAGGNTIGGKSGGLSLAGVGAVYPKYDERFDKLMDLPARINNCFVRSMNGKPLPLDSKEMLALITYFQWISKGLPVYQMVPWLGIKKLELTAEPNPAEGKRLYGLHCVMCHGSHGQGTQVYPPLWGDQAFNNEAGMNRQDILESFIYHNMPQDDPILTEKEARDVAAFVREQTRPILKSQEQKN